MTAEPRRRLALPLALAAVAFAVLVGLGTWQLQRLAWKNDLVARITQRIAAPPVALPPASAWAGLDLGHWEYRPVTLAGRFDHAREARVYTLLGETRGRHDGAGYMILTPLALSDGSGTVLVNRGFVPETHADPATRAEGQAEGEATVAGLVRAPEADNAFTPPPDAARRLFFSRDARVIAPALGLTGPVAPFTVDADATPNPGGLPQGGETRLAFPNRHLEYALTWYGLAAALVGVMIGWGWSRWR